MKKKTQTERLEILEATVSVLWLLSERTRLQDELTRLSEGAPSTVHDALADVNAKLLALGQ